MSQSLTTRMIWAFGLILVIFLADQYTKHLVLNEERFRALDCLNGLVRCGKIEISDGFDLTMVWNRGFSFGLAQSEGIWRWVLFAVQLTVGGVFLSWLFKAERLTTAFALTLIVGGAIGNLVDRFRFGAVVDFVDFSGPWAGIEFNIPDGLRRVEAIFAGGMHNTDGILGLGFPYVFNIADAAISVGAVFLLFDQFFLNRHEEATGAK